MLSKEWAEWQCTNCGEDLRVYVHGSGDCLKNMRRNRNALEAEYERLRTELAGAKEVGNKLFFALNDKITELAVITKSAFTEKELSLLRHMLENGGDMTYKKQDYSAEELEAFWAKLGWPGEEQEG